MALAVLGLADMFVRLGSVVVRQVRVLQFRVAIFGVSMAMAIHVVIVLGWVSW